MVARNFMKKVADILQICLLLVGHHDFEMYRRYSRLIRSCQSGISVLHPDCIGSSQIVVPRYQLNP